MSCWRFDPPLLRPAGAPAMTTLAILALLALLENMHHKGAFRINL